MPSDLPTPKRTLTPGHLRKMQQGRKRAQALRDCEAVQRVKTFQAWLKAGSVLRDIPTLPTDADYAVARRAGAIP